MSQMPAIDAPVVRDQLGSWEVRPGLEELYVIYARALNTSVAHRCVLALGTDQVEGTRRRRLVELATTSTWTTPALAFAHHVGIQRDASPSRAGWVLLELEAALGGERSTKPSSYPVTGSEPWVRYALRSLEQRRRDRGLDWTLEVAIASERERTSAAGAIELLDLAWSPLADAVRTLMRVLVWFQATDRGAIRSGSLPEAHGAVFVRAGTRVIALVHALVCEISNLDIMMRTAVDKLLVNGRDPISEPACHHEGTLADALGGALCAARVSWVMERCGHLVRGRDREDALARAEEAYAQLSHSIDVLLRHGQFTRAGESLVGSLAQRLVRSSF